LYQADEGQIKVRGEMVDFDSPQDAIDAGIGMIHQHFKLVGPLTVAQNVTLGSEPRRSPLWENGRLSSLFNFATDTSSAEESVQEIAGKYGFDIDPTEPIEDISVGEQQRVEILKALYRGSDILILDEPTAVLTPQEVEGLFDVIDELSNQGKTIIFITHKLGEAMHAAEDITVLRDGKNVGRVEAADTTREELAELMVGREVVLEVEKEPRDAGETVFSGRGITVFEDDRPQVNDIDIEVREGEIHGIAGVDGNGQSELADVIGGLEPPDKGSMTLMGKDITNTSRRERIDAGTAYVPEDRQKRGLVMEFTLAENALLGNQHHLPFGEKNSDPKGASEIIDTYDVRGGSVDTSARSLSGGNQQKFIVGREFSRDPKFVLAVHPTRGLDVGSIEFIHEQLLEFRRQDKAVLLISSKLDELQQLADRLSVMYEGNIVDTVDPASTSEQELGLLMAGEHPSKREDVIGDETLKEKS
ncbi:MAG: ABC transporter ATP-binding protein, partial [Halobacteriaceae archaeon]